MKRVNCLYRVSSKQQLHEDDIPVQRAECKLFIDKMEDWEFNKEYLEPAVSGFKTPIEKRKVLQTILEDAKSKKFDVLLVYMSDRIGRKEDETPAYVSALNELGIEVWSVKEGQLKTTEHIDKLLNYIRFWQAEGESRKTGMRVKSAQETMAKAGRFVGGFAPLGYELVYSGEISNHGRALKKLVINEEKAEIVRKIYDYAVNYGYGAFKIAKVLNEEGVPPINDCWKACTVSQILLNPIYKGYIAYNRRQRTACGGNYEKTPMENWILSEEKVTELAIVSEATWDKVQELREGRKSKMKMARDQGHGKYEISSTGKLSLMGLVYCGCCGNRLTNGTKYDYWTTKDGEKRKRMIGQYRCINKANATIDCTGKSYYRSEEIEPIVYGAVTTYLDSLKKADIYDEILAMQEIEREKIKKEVSKLKNQIDSVKKDIETLELNIPSALRGEIPLSVNKLSEMIKDKEENRVKLERSMEEKVSELEKMRINQKDISSIGSIVSNWGEIFMESSIPEKKVMLAKLIERIDILDDDIRIKFKINLADYMEGLPRITSNHDKTRQGEIQQRITSNLDTHWSIYLFFTNSLQIVNPSNFYIIKSDNKIRII